MNKFKNIYTSYFKIEFINQKKEENRIEKEKN